MSNTKPYVDAFAEIMEAKLERNRHKGDREGWKNCTLEYLFKSLRKEVRELKDALEGTANRYGVAEECADVANFAMMIADWKGGLQIDKTNLASAVPVLPLLGDAATTELRGALEKILFITEDSFADERTQDELHQQLLQIHNIAAKAKNEAVSA
jgi:hypothetical protein